MVRECKKEDVVGNSGDDGKIVQGIPRKRGEFSHS
jgi:hypothetical protein